MFIAVRHIRLVPYYLAVAMGGMWCIVMGCHVTRPESMDPEILQHHYYRNLEYIETECILDQCTPSHSGTQIRIQIDNS